MNQPGNNLAGFILERRIHSGGMAAIWRVSHPNAEFPLAMKIPRLTNGDEPAFLVTFEAEQMIFPRLTGANVPRFVAKGDISVEPFIVMEYIEGNSLQSYLKSGAMNPEDIAEYGARVARALHDLHSQQVIHLDISPDNILFRKNGDAVLIDFGLARHGQLPDLMEEELLLPMGTPAYIAPEQVLNIRNDIRSDIFSLGVILYRWITNELPFGAPRSRAGLKRRLYIDPIPPRVINQSCPEWLQEIILCCLAVDPNVRYPSAAHLAFALQHPEQVVLTERAKRNQQKGILKTLGRWFTSTALIPEPTLKTSIQRHLASVPIIMVAVDINSPDEPIVEALRQMVAWMMSQELKARLTCITIRKVPLMGIDFGVDDDGQNLDLQFLIKLKHWARPLNLPTERISFHVISAPDPAAALVNYATLNHVAHIVIGAQSPSPLHRILGGVSAHVVIAAPCTVTVVRIRADDDNSSANLGYASHG